MRLISMLRMLHWLFGGEKSLLRKTPNKRALPLPDRFILRSI